MEECCQWKENSSWREIFKEGLEEVACSWKPLLKKRVQFSVQARPVVGVY